MTGGCDIRSVEIAGSAGTMDISIEDGVITAIDQAGGGGDGFRRVVLPGLVDLHAHLREPGGGAAETIASGTAAAEAGGFTDVSAMANTEPVTDTVERVRDIRARAAGAAARVHPVAAVTRELAGRELTDFRCTCGRRRHAVLRRRQVRHRRGHGPGDAGCDGRVRHGIRPARPGRHPRRWRRGARRSRRPGGSGWPSAGEERIVERDITLAAETGGALHVCHVSTAGTVALLRQAKRQGILVTAEVTPHHLLLTDEDALRAGPRLMVNPPLRSAADRAALLDGLRDGTIDAVGTDHAPHPTAAKSGRWTSAAFGLTALETAFTARRGVHWRTRRRSGLGQPANANVRLARAHRTIEWQAGRPVRPGEPAMLTVIAQVPGRVQAQRHRSLSRNTPFDGWPLSWQVEKTLVEGWTTYARRKGLSGGCRNRGSA